MLVLFGILVIIASVILGIIVLIQNPKGGGLSSSFGGFGNQIMGVKQTTDILEKGTWLFAGIIGLLCLISPAFIPKNGEGTAPNKGLIENISTKTPAATTPAATGTLPTSPDTSKK
ncbi:MAG: preprotein translocase subunit SecG [Ferruginibacter sp.]|nr:preprotein translocase subunit SecG [Bacteroidota bacterium]MBX2919626.1 preprotein translocase subunit SecG [Ferruginibacter sp.]MBX2934015.1 preprotein translocase subunit SecG [Ferruginibacter sp.]MCB0708485.1 preprotein translocase subunit SecG [Chitinophagaceae bacterium]